MRFTRKNSVSASPMKSCLYECRVMHARFAPRVHRFLYRIFLFAIDLDELATLPRRVGLFSVGQRNAYSFREGDFLPTHEALHGGNGNASAHAETPAVTRTAVTASTATPPLPLKERVIAWAAHRGVDISGGRVVLVALPRVFGYLFNPVSFYFCYDRSGAPAAAIAEVTNTFREMKPYFLGPACRSGARGEFRVRVPKHFYVSPYSDVDVAFDFTLRDPGPRLSIRIDDFAGGERTLTSTLTGVQKPLTSARLAWFTLKYPLITLRMIALIHWHALLLWWKRVPWFAKAARPEDQRALYRPHRSIQSSRSA